MPLAREVRRAGKVVRYVADAPGHLVARVEPLEPRRAGDDVLGRRVPVGIDDDEGVDPERREALAEQAVTRLDERRVGARTSELDADGLRDHDHRLMRDDGGEDDLTHRDPRSRRTRA